MNSLTEIDYRTIGEDFHYGEKKGAVFGLGLKMRALRGVYKVEHIVY